MSLFARLRSVFHRSRLDREMDEELRFHIEEQTGRNIAAGMGPDEAARTARRQFGWKDRIREDAREARGWLWLENVGRDLRFAVRMLRKRPMFSTVVVALLAIGIGANTAVFSLADQVLLRLLDVPRPDELVLLKLDVRYEGSSSSDTRQQTTFSHPFYVQLARAPVGAIGLIARAGASVTVSSDGTRDVTAAEIVSGNFFDVLGVRAVLGRTFTTEEDEAPGAHPVVVLSHAYWILRFGGKTDALNQTILVNDQAMTVIGVLPPHFRGLVRGRDPGLFVPIAMKRAISPDGLNDPYFRWLNIAARLSPGVSPADAEDRMQPAFRAALDEMTSAMGTRLSRESIDRLGKARLELIPGGQGINELRLTAQRPIAALAALTTLVLVIACANIAGLLVASHAAREREISIRRSLGASRAAIVRQLLIECGLLAGMGVAAGMALASLITRVLLRLLPISGAGDSIRPDLDMRVIAFGIAVGALAAGLGTLVRALHATARTALALGSSLHHRTRSSARLLHLVVAGQIAVAVMLAVAASLFGRSLLNLAFTDTGYRIDRVLTFSLDPTALGYTDEQGVDLVRQIEERVRALPGVQSAAVATSVPFSGSRSSSNVTVDLEARQSDDVTIEGVGEGYFQTLGIPVLAGRTPSAAELAGRARVALVNENFARLLFGETPVVGRRLVFSKGNGQVFDTEIIGLVQNVRRDVHTPEQPCVYRPYTAITRRLYPTFFVRTARNPRDIASAVGEIVQSIGAGLSRPTVIELHSILDKSLATERTLSFLSLTFAGLATTLAGIGVYGLMAFLATERTHEMGIRLALGARAETLARSVVIDGLRLAAAGIIAGLAGALAAGQLMSSFLFGVQPADPFTLLFVPILVCGVALAASVFPARRAARVDPIIALRAE